jgi:hypothetical protein
MQLVIGQRGESLQGLPGRPGSMPATMP